MRALAYLNSASIAAMVVIIAAMALVEATRPLLIPSFLSLGVVLVAYTVRARTRREGATAPAPAA